MKQISHLALVLSMTVGLLHCAAAAEEADPSPAPVVDPDSVSPMTATGELAADSPAVTSSEKGKKGGTKQQEFYKVVLENVIITSY